MDAEKRRVGEIRDSRQENRVAAVMSASEISSPSVSIVIPVYNGARTIRLVLAAVYASKFPDFEVIIVNDGSGDDTAAVLDGCAAGFPFRLITFERNMGVSRARNAGAHAARGEIILFIDADVLIQPDTIDLCVERLNRGDCVCVGGAYTVDAWDKDFFSRFQSLYIHYVETKNPYPDYIATHCMAIRKDVFEGYGSFIEDSFIGHQASVEDVEFSHRILNAGERLTRPSYIQVTHIFRFSLVRSIRNAVKKSKYWTMYSLKNRDVTKDSGAASYELKANVSTQTLNLVFVVAALATRFWWLLLPVSLLYGANIGVNFNLFKLMLRKRGPWFLIRGLLYFQFIYPFAVAYGSFIGTMKYLWEVKLLRRYG